MLRKIILLLVLAVSALTAAANGDPITWYSSVNRVANPEPLPIPDIKIDHEWINISYLQGYLCYDITYVFKNTSKTNDYPEIHYGFPVDYEVGNEKEERMMLETFIADQGFEAGWSETMVKDMSFTFNGKELPFTVAKESLSAAEYDFEGYENRSDSIKEEFLYEPGINRRWFYTQFGIEAQATDTLNVKYKVYARSYARTDPSHVESVYCRQYFGERWIDFDPSFLLRHFTEAFDILYDFSPAKYFGNGASYLAEINIDLSNLINPRTEIGGYECQVNKISDRWFLLEPGKTPALRFRIYHDVDISEAHIKALLDGFTVPKDLYKKKKAGDKLIIDFKQPTFVTDLACDIDTAAVKSIIATFTYADGNTQDWVYKKDNPHERWNTPKEPLPVSILKVTDVYYNQKYFITREKPMWKKNPDGSWEEWPEFMITKIELQIVPEEGKKADAQALGEIRVIDARP